MTVTRSVATMAFVLSVCSPAAHAYTDFVTPREVRQGKVTACSKYRSECYTAQLVNAPMGWKMRLRNGTVIDCAGDCRDTLRRETVDFWDDQRDRAK